MDAVDIIKSSAKLIHHLIFLLYCNEIQTKNVREYCTQFKEMKKFKHFI